MRKVGVWAVEITIVVLTFLNLIHVFDKPALGDLSATSIRSEFLLDIHRAGDTVDGAVLVQAYDVTYLICVLLSFTVFTLLGSLVLRLRPTEPSVRSFHFLLWSTAALIGVTWTVRDASLMDVVLRGSSVAVHAAFSAALVKFSAMFPQRRSSQIIPRIFTVAAILGSAMGFVTMIPVVYGSSDSMFYVDAHLAVHQFAQFYMKIAAAAVSIYFFIDTFRATSNARSLRQVQWVFLGLSFSMATYIALWIVPRSVLGYALIPESSLLILSCVAPVTFSIAILRYRLLDITVILQTSFVTAITGAVLFALLYGIHQATIEMIGATGGTVEFMISVALLIGIGRYYEPIRAALQRLIDAKVFKITYDYRSSVRKVHHELRSQISLGEVYTYILHTLDSTFKPQRSAVMLFDRESNTLRCVSEMSFGILQKRSIHFDTLALKTTLRLPIILQEQVEPGVECEHADANVFNRWDIACVQPIVGGSDDLVGFIVIGAKSNQRQMTIEDADLLRTLAAQSALAIERLRYYQAMLISTEESRRLQELNDMKTTFVSAVSHDLKVPLTAIKLMAELSIPTQHSDADKKRMEIIIGESDRLTGLIDNVLTYSRIERGALNPEVEPIDLNDITEQTIRSLNYQTQSLGFTITMSLTESPLVILADNIHLLIILQNLVSNAMKYSGSSKNIEIVTRLETGCAVVDIVDHGIGIASDEFERIFAPFERASSVIKSNVAPGTGLGLSIVSELVKRNHGETHVQSTVDVGSTFSISFPISEDHQ